MSVEKIRVAFEEFKKFGEHNGECTFSSYCKLCRRPTGVCELHSSAMMKRMKDMEEAISELE